MAKTRFRKKGQFYLFISLVMIIAAFSVLSQTTVSKKKYTEFDALYDNYINEAKNVINHALYENLDVFIEFDSYTQNFIDYAKTKNTDFKVAYMVKLDQKISVGNYLMTTLNLSSENLTLENKRVKTINYTNEVNISYNENIYNYDFTDEYVQLKALVLK